MNSFISNYWESGLNQFSIYYFIALFIFSCFSLYSSVSSKSWKSFSNVLPTIWTASGIIGTFVSLLNGFSNLDNLAENSEAINNLPFLLSNAFVTSILGLLGAMAISIILSFLEDSNRPEEYYNEAPEKILFDLRNNSFTQNHRIIELLGSLNSNLMSIDKRLEESSSSLIERFDETMKAVSENVKQNINEINKDMFMQISGVMTEFKEISTQAGSHFKELNQNNVSIIAAEMKTLMRSLSDEVSKMQKAISEENEVFVKTQKEAVTMQQEKNEEFLKNSLNKSETILKDQIAQFAKLSETLVSLSEAQQKQQSENWEKSIDSQKEGINGFLNEVSNIKEFAQSTSEDSRKAFQETLATINSNVEKVLNQLHIDFERVSKELQNWAATTELGMNATSNRLKESVTAFDELRENHQKMIEQTKNQLDILQTIAENHESENRKFEQYESRTNELSVAIIQLTELSTAMKEIVSLNKRVNV